MRDPMHPHEPAPEFVARLESQIGSEVRRRNREARAPRWASWSTMQVAAAVAVLIVVSMAVGGAAVAAAYEVQASGRREEIASNVRQRIDLAQKKLEIAMSELKSTETRFHVGMATNHQVLEAGLALAEAKAQVDSLKLQLAEVTQTGVEPRTELLAPLVSGRDFVAERLRIAMTAPEQALAHAKQVARDVQVRVEIGTLEAIDLEASRARILELEAALNTLRKKSQIRQQFVSGKMDKIETELRVLEAEAEQALATLEPKVALARQESARIAGRVHVGTAAEVELAQARLRSLEFETALSKAQLELMVVRRRIDEHRRR